MIFPNYTKGEMLREIAGQLCAEALKVFEGPRRRRARKLVDLLQDSRVPYDHAAAAALYRQGVDLDFKDIYGNTILMHAAIRGDGILFNLLAQERPAHIRLHNTTGGQCALTLAAMNGHAGIVNQLLAMGAEPCAADEAGYSALMRAAQSGDADIITSLVAHGADIEARNSYDGTALQCAVLKRCPPTVRRLLELGAAPVMCLPLAAGQGDAQIVRDLLDARAPLDELGHFGRTALEEARLRRNEEIIEMLENEPQRRAKAARAEHRQQAQARNEAIDNLLETAAVQATRKARFTPKI